ncbi:MAG: YceI family protein [Elusimicrobiota bacterium]|nr:YceI family protein [Elusimicrobiota bacterium]
MNKMSVTILAALLAGNAAASTVSLPDGKACVAWKTRKTMFLVKKVEPVGVNCSVSVALIAEGASKRVRVVVPIAAFDSGDTSRDKAVLDILKSKIQPDLEFLSRPYAAAEWDSLRAGKAEAVEGTLKIGGEEFPVKAALVFKGDGAAAEVGGSLVTTFTAFRIQPPSVAGGAVAKVKDHLELHYRVPLAAVR